MTLTRQDALNQATWSRASSQKWLTELGRFTDDGEKAVLAHIQARARGRPILDLGVGTGRTLPLLSPWTDDYRAIDYLPAMVEACRQSHPGARVDLGDARSLAGLPSGHFGLVYFSFNGIDAVSSTDRRLVLRAVRRVLAPDGLFVFSTLNLLGPAFRERPWRPKVWPAKNPLKTAWRWARSLSAVPLDTGNWLLIRGGGEAGPGFAVAPLSAHHYRVLAHYTTLARQREELHAEGFEADQVFSSTDGAPVAAGTDTSAIPCFHLVARQA